MSPELIAVVLGVAVSILFEAWPQAKQKFDELFTPGQKTLVMAGGGLLVVAVVFGLGCAGLFGLGDVYACSGEGAQDGLIAFVAYFMSNQSAFGVLHAAKKGREQPEG